MYFGLFLMISLKNIWFGGVWKCILGVWTYIFGFGLIFWLYGLIFGVLDSYLCVWAYIWVSGLIFWMSGLIFWVSELILRVSGSGRVGRAAGSGEFSIWGKTHFGNLYPKKNNYWLYYWILNLGYFYKKDARRKMLHFGVLHAPRSLIWDRFRAEN